MINEFDKHSKNREEIIKRIKKEIIGPGSDVLACTPNAEHEVIQGKPLQRYFSGILFPKQTQPTGDGVALSVDSDIDTVDEPIVESREPDIVNDKNGDDKDGTQEDNYRENQSTYTAANTFFPSQYGLSFSVNKSCENITLEISFGIYKQAKYTEIALLYQAIDTDIELIKKFGLDQYANYDAETQVLKLTKDLSKTEKEARNAAVKNFSADHRNSGIFKALTKLFFKDKYRRTPVRIKIPINISKIKQSANQQICIISANELHKKLENNLKIYIKLYEHDELNFVKVILVNDYKHEDKKFSFGNELLNQTCLFQTEIKVCSAGFEPFNGYRSNLYKSDEDQMLDYLYRQKLGYGIGHNTACTWESYGNDTHKPAWVSTTFMPEYDVKSQSTETETIDSRVLNIKNLSSFGNEKVVIIGYLQQVAAAYQTWINNESNDNELGNKNIEKCRTIHKRVLQGIALLENDDNAFRAFQLANTAIYLQMFQTALNFDKKDGYESYENRTLQYTYQEYQQQPFPDTKPIPTWRPFQLAFILQVLPSLVQENNPDTDLVDLLYFPTGGGKTEAYLGVSAFLIFYRRLQYPQTYGGVNIIIRYTLRLLSAQQFERATKLILACEFIRKNEQNLGDQKISIGFWVGDSTLPNTHEKAFEELKKAQTRLNRSQAATNPFQVPNCQWCNTKMVSKIEESKLIQSIGHRMDKKTSPLQTHCLNSNCQFCEKKGGLPLVLVDDDIYAAPPTMLFGTVDKFAQLAWKGEATTLFNSYPNKDNIDIQNRRPELIIQDELHLLNGTLGSLVGLFENLIQKLCTTNTQKPKIIASTATIKNIDQQISGLYGKKVAIFPQYATNADDTFFSKTQNTSKRRYVGVMPTGKTSTVTNLRLSAALLFARLEIWQNANEKSTADGFWTVLTYFKSLKDIGRFAHKVSDELKTETRQLQVRNLKNTDNLAYNYRKLSYRHLELTSRIPNEKIKRNLDKLSTNFDGDLKNHKAYDIVLASNMISVGLDVSRLNVMIMNGMPPNTAEYIQASSRVARSNEGVVFTLYDPNNTRDLSFFEDFVLFHKTFYKQVEPLSVTPFAENALDKMLFTLIIAYSRHELGKAANNMATALIEADFKEKLNNQLNNLFENHSFASDADKRLLTQKITDLLQVWKGRIDANPKDLFYYGGKDINKNLLVKPDEAHQGNALRQAMQSMRSVEPQAIINIKKY